MVYFFLGKTKDGKDILAELGGDSVDAGTLHLATIGQGRYELHHKIFP